VARGLWRSIGETGFATYALIRALLRQLACAAWAAAGLIVSGCAGDSSEAIAHPPMKFINTGLQRTSGSTTIRGGMLRERALLRTLIDAIDSQSIRLVTVGPPPTPWRADPRQEIYGNKWLTIHVRAASSAPFAYGLASWKAHLVAGAFRDAAKARAIATVLGFRGVVEYPKEETRATGQVIAGTFVHDVSRASAGRLAEQIRRSYQALAEQARITLVRVSFVKPTQLAPLIDVVARRPDVVASHVSEITSLRPEGFLLRVRSLDGRPFALRSFAARSSSGASWTADTVPNGRRGR
jgi:hypothetical protein